MHDLLDGQGRTVQPVFVRTVEDRGVMDPVGQFRFRGQSQCRQTAEMHGVGGSRHEDGVIVFDGRQQANGVTLYNPVITLTPFINR